MVIGWGNINTKKINWKEFDDQIFLCILNYDFFLLSFLFNESNSLEGSSFKFKFSIR
jgi:hypothetical protein